MQHYVAHVAHKKSGTQCNDISCCKCSKGSLYALHQPNTYIKKKKNVAVMFCGMWKFNVVGALVTRPVVLSWQLGSAQLNSLPVFATRERFFVVSSLLSPYSHHMPLNRLNVSVLGAQLSHSWRRNVCVWGVKNNPPKRMMCECVLAFATFQAFRTYLCLRLFLLLLLFLSWEHELLFNSCLLEQNLKPHFAKGKP